MTKRICFLTAALAPVLFAQDAELGGFVKDPAGTTVPRASIEVRNQDTGIRQQTLSNGEGLYSIGGLKPGSYLVTVQANGFKTLTRDGIVLQVEQRARLDLTLELGSVEEKVTVTADAPLVDSNDATVSTVVDRGFVENMPLNGRSFQNLIALSPGVVITPTSTDDEGQFSIAGQRAGSNYFTVDGVSANFAASNGIFQSQTANGALPAVSALGSTASLVSIDALQEFRLETSTYAPEYGRESGGQVVLVTRSGTNHFHGTAFDYSRNSVLDASDWFADSAGLPKPIERQNDFGGVLGGPIIKDRTFFFFSYEGLRSAQPFLAISDVPSVEARASAAPNIKAIVDAFPLPNGPSTGPDQNQLAVSRSHDSTLDAASLRIDHTISSKLNFFGRYNHAPSHLLTTGALKSANGQNRVVQDIDTATLGLTAILTPSITNEFRLNYSRAHGENICSTNNYGGATVPPLSQLGAPWQDLNTGWFFLGVNSGRNIALCVGPLADNLNRQINATETLDVVRGTHTLKFGFDLRRLTPIQKPSSSGAYYGWDTMPSFISGAVPDLTEIITNPAEVDMRFYNFSAFAQDTWRATRRLTLTYGVRWDHNPPPVVTSGNPPYAISEITNLAAATLLPPGSPLWHADWKNFAPRAGISYLLRQSTERPTVLRAGFGQFFDLGTSSSAALSNAEGYFPYSLATLTCLYGSGPDCSSGVPYSGSEPPFVFTQPYPQMRAFDPHLRLPYSLEWNVAIEQGITPDQTFKISYVGSAGRRLMRDDLISNPNPMFSGLFLTRNSSYSNYDSLQLQFQRRLTRGLQALVSYSWSHSLDLNSADVTTGWNATTAIPTTLFNIHQDYGDSDFDIRHSFSAAITYSIPTANIQNRFARAVFRDWSIDSINTARTGTPFNVLYQPATPGAYVDQSGAAIQLRPDSIPGQPVWISDPNAPRGKRLNPAAFTIPSTLGQGSEGRNSIRGFPLVQLDIALRRQFRLGENLNLQFRAEAFNVINHPNFGPPLNNMGICSLGAQCTAVFGWGTSQAMLNQSMGASGGDYATPFGSLYQVGGPRSLQLSMKLQF
jgi:hypothetical protein